MKRQSYILPTLLYSLLAFAAICQPAAAEKGRFKVGDYTLSYTCAGEGQPAVYLEPPSGVSAEEAFAPVFDRIARETKVCRFERLGFGLSDPIPQGLTQTVADYAEELNTLVHQTTPSGNIAVVGYSFGGLVTRYYASRHPERVAGLVLIDAAHESWMQDNKRQMSDSDWAKMQEILDWYLANLGHDYWNSQFQVAASTLPANLPIQIVSRGLDYQRMRQASLSEEGFRFYNDLHNHYQKVQESLTDNTQRRVAKNSEHLILESEPDVVMAALQELLQTIRR